MYGITHENICHTGFVKKHNIICICYWLKLLKVERDFLFSENIIDFLFLLMANWHSSILSFITTALNSQVITTHCQSMGREGSRVWAGGIIVLAPHTK